MSRIPYGRLLLSLKTGKITPVEFLTQNKPVYPPQEFTEVTLDELGKHRKHESAHAQVLREVGIKYSFHLSKDKKVACITPDEEEFKKYASALNNKLFIEFLLKYHNPPVKDFKLDGTDLFVCKVLTGEIVSENDMLAFELMKNVF